MSQKNSIDKDAKIRQARLPHHHQVFYLFQMVPKSRNLQILRRQCCLAKIRNGSWFFSVSCVASLTIAPPCVTLTDCALKSIVGGQSRPQIGNAWGTPLILLPYPRNLPQHQFRPFSNKGG